ncbi:MAG: hypothetical protein M0Z25_05955 [Nitrospiraceae bacterium]|nr:hypothetical protein [Nitrospiraceae bacterium]
MTFLLSLPSCGTGGGGTGGSPPPSTSFSAPSGTASPTSFGKIAIDRKNNAWVTTNTGLMEIPAGVTSCATASDCPLFPLGFGPAGIAVDSSNDIWVTNDTSTGSVTEIPSGVTSCSSSSCPTFYGSTYFSNPTGIAVDSNNNIWVTNDTSTGSVTEIPTSAISAASCSFSSSPCKTFSGFTSPTGIAVDSNNNIWVTNDTSTGTVTEIPSNVIPSSTSCSSSCPTFSGFSYPVAVTTTGTIPWVANTRTGSSYSPGIVEIVSSCPSGSCSEITHFSKPVGLAFDTSGNLWVIDAGNNTTVEITNLAIYSASCTTQTPCYQYSLPAVPEGVASDSLGNVWISIATAHVIEYKP